MAKVAPAKNKPAPKSETQTPVEPAAAAEPVELESSIPGHFSVGQAADKLGLSKATVVSLIKNGKLKAAKVGGVYLISELALASVDSVRGNARNRVEISNVVRLPITCPNCDHVIEAVE